MTLLTLLTGRRGARPRTADELAALMPTVVPDPEQLVYQHLIAATADGTPPPGAPALQFYSDSARAAAEGLKVDVVRGWPAYPGKVPAIGVAVGTEGEDQQNEIISAGYAGEGIAYDTDGVTVLGKCDYYAEPLYVPVVVELIHENRDERDRLHRQLRRILFPLKTLLPAIDGQIKDVRVDATKDEVNGGPPQAEEPFTVYVSIFTVHVTCEMLEARNVVGVDQLVRSIKVTVTPE